MVFLLAMLCLPLMLLFAAWVGKRAAEEPAPRDAEPSPAALKARATLTAIILAVAAASITYRAVLDKGLQQTAALFIGVPVVLAVVVIFTTNPRSATGVAFKAVTVGMLLSVLVLWEGVVCVVMAAPLFYLIAVLITFPVDRRRRTQPGSGTLYSCLIVLAIAPLSLEGVTEWTTFDRHTSVTVSRVVHASTAEVERALAEAPRFERVLPWYLRAGFPRPVASRIERRDAQPLRWVITMRGGETFLNGTEPETGDLTMDLAERGPHRIAWRTVSDRSHMTHFLTFRESIVAWEPIDSRTTQVTWVIRYERGLDPAWYFGPMERYAVTLAAGYLIDAVATP